MLAFNHDCLGTVSEATPKRRRRANATGGKAGSTKASRTIVLKAEPVVADGGGLAHQGLREGAEPLKVGPAVLPPHLR